MKQLMKQWFQKWGRLSLVLVFTVTFISGCSTDEEKVQDEEQDNQSEEVLNELEEINEEAQEQLFPVTMTDATGKELTIKEQPKTIISLLPSHTEIAFALGLGDKMVGVTAYCNYPEEALEIEKVGAQEINVELILTLLPDLALVNSYHYQNYPDVLQQFEEVGIDVLVINDAATFTDVYETIELIATATGTLNHAEQIINDMKYRLNAIKEKAKLVTDQRTVWVEVSPAPDLFTTGKGTFIHEILTSIQAINAAGEQEGWVKLTEEEIVQLQPDVIITTYGYYVENPKELVLARDGWAKVPAIKKNRIFDIDNDTVTRPGPRLIEGVEIFAKLIYPEVFEE